jgi:hypothetical protein
MIQNKQELEVVAERAGGDLQQIQDYLKRTTDPSGKVRFPRGYLLTAQEIRNTLPHIKNTILLKNMSYALMTADVYRWLVIRTDIAGIAKEMIIKEGICILGFVCESLTKHFLTTNRLISNKKGYKDRTAKLVQLGIIDTDLKNELDWIWDKRGNEHLFLVEYIENDHYKVEDYNRARKSFHSLRDALKSYFG